MRRARIRTYMPKLVIASSNLNMNPRAAVLGSLEDHQSFLKNGGYRNGAEIGGSQAQYSGGGFEWSEARNPRNLAGKMALRLAATDICSLHQSWRSTKLSEIVTRPSLASIGLGLTIPHITGSLSRLAQVQWYAGRQLPVVAHPNQQQPPGESPRFELDYPAEAYSFSELRHQPTAETLQAWRVLSKNPRKTVEGMLEVQERLGFGGVAWDTKHGEEERHGFRFDDPVGMVTELAGRGGLQELQLNFAEDSHSLGEAVEDRLAGTHHGEILQAAVGAMAADSTLLVVTEVPAREFERIGIADAAAGHRMLVESVVRTATS